MPPSGGPLGAGDGLGVGERVGVAVGCRLALLAVADVDGVTTVPLQELSSMPRSTTPTFRRRVTCGSLLANRLNR